MEGGGVVARRRGLRSLMDGLEGVGGRGGMGWMDRWMDGGRDVYGGFTLKMMLFFCFVASCLGEGDDGKDRIRCCEERKKLKEIYLATLKKGTPGNETSRFISISISFSINQSNTHSLTHIPYVRGKKSDHHLFLFLSFFRGIDSGARVASQSNQDPQALLPCRLPSWPLAIAFFFIFSSLPAA